MKYSYLLVLVGAMTLTACNQGPDEEFGREVTDPRMDTMDRTQSGAPGAQTQRAPTTQQQSQPASQQPVQPAQQSTQPSPGAYPQQTLPPQ